MTGNNPIPRKLLKACRQEQRKRIPVQISEVFPGKRSEKSAGRKIMAAFSLEYFPNKFFQDFQNKSLEK